MANLVSSIIFGLVLVGLGLSFMVGARTIDDLSKGIVYPPTAGRPRPDQKRPIGWWTLLPIRWFGFTLLCAGAAVLVWSFWSPD